MFDSGAAYSLTPAKPPAVAARFHRRARIFALQDAAHAEIDAGNVQDITDTMPLDHSFIPGAYARALTIPAGGLVVGEIHRNPCFNVVKAGKVTVYTENGSTTLQAPAFFSSGAGTKRVLLAHEDTIWITIHPTTETDLEKLEAELTCENYEQLGQIEAQPQEALKWLGRT